MSYVHADLHTHSLASDGALSPAALVARARERNVQMLSITDHDTMAAYATLGAQCAELTSEDPAECAADSSTSLRLIPGVELSTTWSGVGIHVLGLHVDPANAELRAGLAHQADARMSRASRIATVLTKAGFQVDVDAVLQSTSGLIGRPHFARYLVSTGQADDEPSVFRKHLGAGKAGDIKVGWASLEETISWIRSAGGIATLAHPARYKLTRTKLRRLVDAFAEAGGEALEVISGHQTDDVTARLVKLCQLRQLLASCGSDFHRESKYAPDVGSPMTLPESCEPVWSRF